MPDMSKKYKDEVKPALMQKLGYKNKRYKYINTDCGTHACRNIEPEQVTETGGREEDYPLLKNHTSDFKDPICYQDKR